MDAGVAGQQRLVGPARFASRPSDLAARPLQVEHEVDGLAHGRPHRLDEPAVAGDQHVVPDAGGQVGAEVAVAVAVLDDAVRSWIGHEPSGRCVVAAPVEGGAGGFDSPAAVSAIADSTWSHGSVCPPANHGIAPEVSCAAAIDCAVCRHWRGRQHARHARERRSQRRTGAPPASRSTARRSCRSAGSAALGRPGQPRAARSCPRPAACGTPPPRGAPFSTSRQRI